jgi:small-conductance mechanosensitive channel
LNVYTNESNALASIYSELHQHILDVCAAKGIEIMSPHYRAERDGNELAIPKSVDDSKKAKK